MSNQPIQNVDPNLVNIGGTAPSEGELLYTEKVTKTTTYDKDGNILDIAENVDREPARPGVYVREHESYHFAPDGTLKPNQDFVGDAASASMAPGQATVPQGTHASPGLGMATSGAAGKASGEVSSSTRKSKITDPGMSM